MKFRWLCCIVASCLLLSCSSGSTTAGDGLLDPGRDDVPTDSAPTDGVHADDVPTSDIPRDDIPDDGTMPCVSTCDTEGALGCSEDSRSVLECTNEGTVEAPCLQWTPGEACLETETCEGGDCVPQETGCCTVDGAGCCEGTDDCCEDDAATDACRVLNANRNGSEACDDSIRVTLDPEVNRFFLLCLNDHGGTAYVSTNSGGPCGDPFIERCQCWEESGLRPWAELDYVAQLVCDRVGKRLEVTIPEAGRYHFGVHSVPGDYDPLGYCPRGDGCMTCIALLQLPIQP